MTLTNDAPAHFPTLAAEMQKSTATLLTNEHGPLGQKAAYGVYLLPGDEFTLVLLHKTKLGVFEVLVEAYRTLSAVRTRIACLKEIHARGDLDAFLNECYAKGATRPTS